MSEKLIQEVWVPQRCSGCGVCVATCSKGILYWSDEQHPLLEEREKTIGLTHLKLRACEVCEKFCELSCPRLVDWTPIEASNILATRSAGVVQSSAPNDVVQSLLIAARSADLIDGVVMLDMDPWTLTPIARVALTVSEITDGVGMQYLWAPVLSALNQAIFELDLTKLAVVGPPCVAEAVRLLANVDNERLMPYQQVLRLIISQFCTGVYMPNMISELLEDGKGIPRHLVRSITTSTEKGTMEVLLWDGATHTIPLTEVERFTRHGCSTCTDFLGEQADIAVGSVGTEEGFATLIVRTMAGKTFVQNALRYGLLETTDKVNKKALEVAKEEKDRRARAQAFDKLHILMLDALSDPKKRAVVRKQFVNLYGTSEGKAKNKENLNVSCSGC